MLQATKEFRKAIGSAGLSPREAIQRDGRLHRFPSNGTRSDARQSKLGSR
jgi:hypothetical protein